MANEMIVAIIGAGAAILGAIFSTISILISNKNTKSLKMLENSQRVKASIAEKRYTTYLKVINYINSWYDIKPSHNLNYSKCKARENLKMSVFENRLQDRDCIIKELQAVSKLSIEYFYLDGKTYGLLKSLEAYLSNVINYSYNEEIDNFAFFSYVVYTDMWEYIFVISKHVNKFIKSKDILKFKPSKKVKDKYYRMFYNTEFFNIFHVGAYNEKQIKSWMEKVDYSINKINEDISRFETSLNSIEDDEKRLQICRMIITLKNTKAKLKKLKKYPSFNSIKVTKMYQVWKICQTCDNEACILNKNYNKMEKK